MPFKLVRLLLSLVVLISLAPWKLHAQAKQKLLLYHLNEKNGLSDNLVTCFYQDTKGIMWIGTQDGLNSYDGSVFKQYFPSKDSVALAGKMISSIKEDAHGNIWTASEKGLAVLNAATGKLWCYSGQEAMSDMVIDSHNTIWAGTANGLISFYITDQQLHHHYNQVLTGTAGRRSNHINKTVLDADQTIWIGTSEGLWHYSPITNDFKPAPGTEGLIQSLQIGHDNVLWLGYWQLGLKSFNTKTGVVMDLNTAESPRMVSGIAEIKNRDGSYTLWCNNLAAFDEVSKKFTCYTDANNSTGFYAESKLFNSKEGLLWISSENGCYIMDPAKQFFRHHVLATGSITHQGIAFLQRKNDIYIGGAGKHFLNLYDLSFRYLKPVLPQPAFKTATGMVSPALLNIIPEDDHRIWLCTENGLMLYDEQKGNYKRFTIPEKETPVLTRGFITNMFIDSKRNQWIFPWRCGIWKLDASSGKFTKTFTGFLKDNNECKELVIVAAAEDASGNIWFADLDEGLILYEPATNTFSKPTREKYGDRYSMQNVIADSHNVWGVKAETVFAIDINTHRLFEWKLPEEFNKPVTGFCADKYGNLWIQTTGGIVLFNTSTHSFRRYTVDDGLMETVVKGSLYSLNDGRMVYAYNNYVTEFNARNISSSGTIPKVMITAIRSQDKLLNPSVSVNGSKSIELDHTYNNFTFSWAVLNYSNPLKNTFYCKLEGVDKEWRFTGYKGEVQYSALLPGKYLLRVKGAASDGTMNQTGDALEIIILPAIWQRWWFIVSAALLGLGVLILMVRYVAQRNLKERLLKLENEQVIEKERNRISRDMHDDLGSGLTKIAIMSEVVKKQLYEPEKAKEQLDNISISSRELVDNLQDIIWVLNTKHDTLESLAAYIREYALKYFEPFDIELHFKYPAEFSEVRLSEEQRRNLFLIVKETFHNISKHAWCNNITICINYLMQSLQITVADDGKGFNMNDVKLFGNGLINMQSRMQQVGGRYTIDSQPGKGTTTNIELKV
jgi:signal transduction histidine kinase/ligand-binding sensor domain-containing protein